MILLIATRLDVHGRFRFTIDAPGRCRTETTDPGAVEAALTALGVDDPAVVVDHVREWGTLEILEPQWRQMRW
jgi:hypothetical protein